MIGKFITDNNLPAYRASQFHQAFYVDFAESIDEVTTWPKALREKLIHTIPFSTLNKVKELESADKKTVKVLLSRVSDGQFLEAVLMRHRDGRNTVCVSCMIGCPIGCTFCATGKMGFKAQLTGREIVDQVLYFERFLKKDKEKVTNIVFMGMGEPLINLQNVMEAIRVFCDPEKLALSMRRITISTSGITPNLKELLKTEYKGRLALSLHAPNQKLREKIMPVALKFPLPELLDVFHEYAQRTNKRVSFEYILIDSVNDTPHHAEELVNLLGTHLTHVNLIPYNPVAGNSYQRSTPQAVRQFSNILSKYGLQHTVRVTMGDDIKAACGQLANG
ncbi:MAG: 23S rRNA (adenine(2503)-C(2))-methyltransferase RlmN [Patescibacteria group bacterium]|jgi:23S rRNA (adenine2503-C2)-methyltransferase